MHLYIAIHSNRAFSFHSMNRIIPLLAMQLSKMGQGITEICVLYLNNQKCPVQVKNSYNTALITLNFDFHIFFSVSTDSLGIVD